jgi:lipopolysaccharide export system protein LptA
MISFRLALAAALVLSAPAAAQLPVSSLRNHDTKAPIDVDAGNMELRDKERVAFLTGAVTIKQGQMTLRTERMRIQYNRDGERLSILRADAQGAVSLTSPSETAKAAWGIYDVEQEQVTLGGDVVLTRGTDVLRGQRLELNLRTGITTLDGGASATASEPGSTGRVQARFAVPQRSGQ